MRTAALLLPLAHAASISVAPEALVAEAAAGRRGDEHLQFVHIPKTGGSSIVEMGNKVGVKWGDRRVNWPGQKRGEDTRYFYAPAANVGVSGRIRELTKRGSPTAEPAMVLRDIADEGGYYVSPAKEVTPETVTSFLEGYKAGALERLQLS